MHQPDEPHFYGASKPWGPRDALHDVASVAKVYYYYGKTGWGTTYGGLPTVMLGAPAPQVGTASLGVKSDGFSFTINRRR